MSQTAPLLFPCVLSSVCMPLHPDRTFQQILPTNVWKVWGLAQKFGNYLRLGIRLEGVAIKGSRASFTWRSSERFCLLLAHRQVKDATPQLPWLITCSMKRTARTFWYAGKQTRSVWPLTDWKVSRNQIRRSNVAHHFQSQTGLASYQDKMPPVSSNSQAEDSNTKRRAKPRKLLQADLWSKFNPVLWLWCARQLHSASAYWWQMVAGGLPLACLQVDLHDTGGGEL